MSDRSPDTQDTPPEATQNGDIDSFRRKLTGSALGVSAIFTLASRPVLAGQCMTPSSAASGNLSHHGTGNNCTGSTALTWAGTAPNTYPSGPNGRTGNPKFKDVFSNGTKATWGDNDKLDDVLKDTNNTDNTGTKPNPISKEFAATLLNIRRSSTSVPVLTETQLIGMWNEWKASGVFTPKAGATWDTATIVWYLQSLQN